MHYYSHALHCVNVQPLMSAVAALVPMKFVQTSVEAFSVSVMMAISIIRGTAKV